MYDSRLYLVIHVNLTYITTIRYSQLIYTTATDRMPKSILKLYCVKINAKCNMSIPLNCRQNFE